MLGWEYPPHISGGLGRACEGLTKALANLGIQIDFVVPTLYGDEAAGHMHLMDGSTLPSTSGYFQSITNQLGLLSEKEQFEEKSRRIKRYPIVSYLSPYLTQEQYSHFYTYWRENLRTGEPGSLRATLQHLLPINFENYESRQTSRRAEEHYGTDLFSEVARYTENLVELMRHQSFDLIHAHDWMTFPAGIALTALTSKPLIVHIHSLEFDRSGYNVNPRIHQIERFGLHAADAIVAVSHYTKAIICKQYDIPEQKVFVVHNGVYSHETVELYRSTKKSHSKVVLFLGRVTFQKGPDYFVEAAAKVIPHVDDVLFIMAGEGDMLPNLIKRVRELGIEKQFLFTGFLRGQEVEQMYSTADLYVMPSVSEPFGISTLEAINLETPVLISRQSGVAEVLKHALKVDFWDTDRMAELIISALNYPELRDDMVSMAKEEVQRLHWDLAGKKVINLYRALL